MKEIKEISEKAIEQLKHGLVLESKSPYVYPRVLDESIRVERIVEYPLQYEVEISYMVENLQSKQKSGFIIRLNKETLKEESDWLYGENLQEWNRNK